MSVSSLLGRGAGFPPPLPIEATYLFRERSLAQPSSFSSSLRPVVLRWAAVLRRFDISLWSRRAMVVKPVRPASHLALACPDDRAYSSTSSKHGCALFFVCFPFCFLFGRITLATKIDDVLVFRFGLLALGDRRRLKRSLAMRVIGGRPARV